VNLADKPNQPVTARTLAYLAKQTLDQKTSKPRPVLVRGDKNVNYGKVIEAMALLQKAGAKSVGLITQPVSDKASG
jgi:biopolymer transport protein TolR